MGQSVAPALGQVAGPQHCCDEESLGDGGATAFIPEFTGESYPGIGQLPPPGFVITATLARRSGEKLGLDLEFVPEREAMPVRAVTGGVVMRWNLEHPDDAILPGDRIVEVNGCKGMAEGMMKALKSETTMVALTVVRLRAEDSQAADDWEFIQLLDSLIQAPADEARGAGPGPTLISSPGPDDAEWRQQLKPAHGRQVRGEAFGQSAFDGGLGERVAGPEKSARRSRGRSLNDGELEAVDTRAEGYSGAAPIKGGAFPEDAQPTASPPQFAPREAPLARSAPAASSAQEQPETRFQSPPAKTPQETPRETPARSKAAPRRVSEKGQEALLEKARDSLPAPWQPVWSRSQNRYYYYNADTGKTSWVKPQQE